MKICPLCKGKGTTVKVDGVTIKDGQLINQVNPRMAVCMVCEGIGCVGLDLTCDQEKALSALVDALNWATESGLLDVLAVAPNGPTIINEFCDLVSEAKNVR
jgi:RecJ-like exonuclease